MNDVPEVLTVSEVRRALNVTQQTVYKMLREGQLKGFKLPGNGRWRVYRASLGEYMGSVEDTAFAKMVRKTFPESDSIHRRVLELRYRTGLSRDEVCEELGVAEDKVQHWIVDALLAIRPALLAGLDYNDVAEDNFALRVLAQISLAQEE